MNKEGIAKMSKRKYLEEPGKEKTCYIWNAPWEKVAARHYAGAGKDVASGAHGKKEGGASTQETNLKGLCVKRWQKHLRSRSCRPLDC